MKPDIPKTIGQFEIIAHLDSGGMADVYLAHNSLSPDGSKLAVIKILKEKFKNETELSAMFLDEARLLSRLSHPNVVKYLGSGSIQDRPYIVMEYLAGDNLGVLAKSAQKQNEKLSSSLITRICLQAANALDYIHNLKDDRGNSLHLVHRDISPQNILVTYDGRVKLLDFGIAWTEDRSVATRTGLLKGKLRYMSPEQIESRDLDARSDLFSMGIVMWEITTDRKLFKADSEFQTMKNICEEPIPSPDQYREDLPVSLEAIIMGLLRRDPEERYQTAAELRTALLSFLQDGCHGSHPDEIAKEAHRLLSDRKKMKENAIGDLSPQSPLKEALFANIDQSGEISTTASVAKSPDGIDAALLNQSRPILKKKFIWLAIAIGISLMLTATAGLLMTINGDISPSDKLRLPLADAGGKAPVLDAGVIPSESEPGLDAQALTFSEENEDSQDAGAPEDAQPSDSTPLQVMTAKPGDAHETDQSQEQKTEYGFLMLRTEPKTKVFVGDEYIGETPVTEMKLKTGKYTITMINKEAGIKKKVKLTIRPQEVTAQQYIF